MKYLIGIDVGTSATKTVLFDERGRAVASASKEYPMEQPENGWAQQRPEDWRDAVLSTLKTVSASVENREDILGIGLSGQMHGLVMLDEEGQVIRPAIIWCDQRAKEETEDMLKAMPREEWIRITANPPLAGWTAAKICWVKKHEPDNYRRCRHILLPKDYIRYILTGVHATEVSDASGMQLLDVPGRCWSKEVLKALSIDESLLGQVYESCEATGCLRREIARELGLGSQVVVAGGAGDNAAAAVGTGIVEDGRAFTTIGTSGVVFAHSSQLCIDPKGRVHTCCCAVPGAWHVMGVTQAAGLSLKWFRDQLCQEEIRRAEEEGRDVYDRLNEMAGRIPAGSDRLIYLPYLMGERTPHLDSDCRGVFFGLSGIHTKGHMLRAVMEGVAYSLCDCNQILNEMGITVGEMMACGGGGRSPLWRQMLADLYQCTVKTVEQSEGPALGAAILAGVACKLYPSVEEACHVIIHEESQTFPHEAESRLYGEYHKVYQGLYRSLREDYQKLAALP